MKKRENFKVEFAHNGIIVTPAYPDYSRNCGPAEDEILVFNSMVEFEKWFERHCEGDEPGVPAFEQHHAAIKGDWSEFLLTRLATSRSRICRRRSI